jgi:uncharacterized protein (TIGR02996 family)
MDADPVLDMLLRAVIAHPDDDGPRLAFADRLEETGADDARAEFIRVQCTMEPVRAVCGCCSCVQRRGGGQHHNGPCGLDGREHRHLKRRERELLACDFFPAWCPRVIADNVNTSRYCRGFVAEVVLPCDAWQRHGPALVRAAPLGRVVLSGVVRGGETGAYLPGDETRADDMHGWVIFRGGGEGDIPDELFRLLGVPRCADPAHVHAGTHCHFAQRGDAQRSLSAACLAWARAVAPAGVPA